MRFDPDRDFAAMLRPITKVVLEKLELHGRRHVRPIAFTGAEFRMIEDAARGMAIELSAYVWSQKLQDETATLTVKMPATWWQHFKQSCFPRWALRRWPPREKEVIQSWRFRTLALLPGFKYQAPDRCGKETIVTILDPE